MKLWFNPTQGLGAGIWDYLTAFPFDLFFRPLPRWTHANHVFFCLCCWMPQSLLSTSDVVWDLVISKWRFALPSKTLQKDPGKGEEITVLFGSLHCGYCHLPAQMGLFSPCYLVCPQIGFPQLFWLLRLEFHGLLKLPRSFSSYPHSLSSFIKSWRLWRAEEEAVH